MSRKPLGFSLVELSVALAISALVGLALWKFLAVSQPVAEGNPVEQSLLQAQQAIEGFAQTNFRLPCPADVPGGSENCASGNTTGWLPARTLGLSSIDPLRYGAGSVLRLSQSRYSPALPPVATTNVQISTSNGYTSPINGLDFCVALESSSTGLSSGSINVAYALAHAGANHTFEGANTSSTGFEAPGSPQTTNYDDKVAAVGPGELFARMGCAVRLDAVNGTARSAYAAYDMNRLAVIFHTFRSFEVTVRQFDLQLAEAILAFGIVDSLVAATNTAIDIANMAMATELEPAAIVGLAADFVTIGTLIATNVLAGQDVTDAIDAVKTAQDQEKQAADYQTWATGYAAQMLAAAIANDRQGLLP